MLPLGVPGGGGDAASADRIDGPIARAAAAMELLHTMALIHDDLMDEAAERRDVAATAPHLAGEALRRGFPVEADRFGRAGALLAGDLAAVLADRLLLTSGFDPTSLARALSPYHEMRLDMAAGQLLDVAGIAGEPDAALAAARLKGGSYTVEGPLLVGAALAADAPEVADALRAYGAPLGEAFQLRDDLQDREGAHGATPETVNALVARARDELREAADRPRRRRRPRRAGVVDGDGVSDDLEGLRRSFRDVPACRIATVRPDGGPYVAPRWFVWRDDGIWVSTRVGDTTWEHALRDARVSVLIDRGRDWSELAGVRLEGVAEAYPAEHPDLRAPMSNWHEKYRPMFARRRVRGVQPRRALPRVPAGRAFARRCLEPPLTSGR